MKLYRQTFIILIVSLLSSSTLAIAGNDLPANWQAGNTKDYDIGADHMTAHEGGTSAYIKSRTETPANFGTIVQSFGAEKYTGKRVRMSAFVKADKIEKWAGLWMRVDGTGRDEVSLSFDNMQTRPITGTLDWKKYEIVLDVPTNSKTITFGILLTGPGKAWLDDFSFEVVTEEVPVTSPSRVLPGHEPANLGFED